MKSILRLAIEVLLYIFLVLCGVFRVYSTVEEWKLHKPDNPSDMFLAIFFVYSGLLSITIGTAGLLQKCHGVIGEVARDVLIFGVRLVEATVAVIYLCALIGVILKFLKSLK